MKLEFRNKSTSRLAGYESYDVWLGDIYLGEVDTSPSMQGKFRISKIANKSNPLGLTAFKCQNKEEAGNVLLAIYKAVETNPLTDELRLYLEEQWRSFQNERKYLLEQIMENQQKASAFAALAKKYKLEFWHQLDMTTEIKEFNEFLDRDIEALYEHMGKDWARSLRARLAAIVRLVDPEAADLL